MISIILSVLKIIGIVLLVILAIAVVLLLLVLFVPICYQGQFSRESAADQKLQGRVVASYMGRLVRFTLQVSGMEVRMYLKILFVVIFDSALEEEEECLEKTAPVNASNGADIAQNASASRQSAADADTFADVNRTEKASKHEHNKTKETKKTKKLASLRSTWHNLCDKIKNIRDTIGYYKGLFQSDEFSVCFALLQSQVVYFIRHLKPKELKGYIKFGFDDPTYTGYGMAVYGIFYAFWGKALRVVPDFEKEVLEADLSFKGHFAIFRLIMILGRLYFSKESHYVLNQLRSNSRRTNHE